jgi:hypothetical protein
LPVDLLAARGEAAEAGAGARARDRRSCRPAAAMERTFEGGRLAAAGKHDIEGQQILEPLQTALLDSRAEAGRELSGLRGMSLSATKEAKRDA